MNGQPKTAWTDPEHMRLCSWLSWWDRNANGPAARGPLPELADPWAAPFRRCGGGTSAS